MLEIDRINDRINEPIIHVLAVKGSIYFNTKINISIETMNTSDNIIIKKLFIFFIYLINLKYQIF